MFSKRGKIVLIITLATVVAVVVVVVSGRLIFATEWAYIVLAEEQISTATEAGFVTSMSVIKEPVPPIRELQSYSSSSDRLNTWEPNSFCEKYLSNAFQNSIPICKPPATGLTEQIQCRGLEPTVMCTLYNIAVLEPVREYKGRFVIDHNLALIGSPESHSCPSPAYTESSKGLFIRDIFKSLESMQTASETICKRWVNETTLLSFSSTIHIYFKFIGWYNVYKALLEIGAAENVGKVRVNSDGLKYLFPEFEQRLFPNMTDIKSFQNETVCFKKLVVTPHYLDSPQFQCKLSTAMAEKCFKCDGKGRVGTEMMAFRSAVLRACSIDDSVPTSTCSDPRTIVVILRKPYKRWSKDKPENFQRCLQNSEELLSALKGRFPQANVTGVHLEDMDICSQIRSAHDADVLLGVHGAGLVHLWWLREEALVLELVPDFAISNPTFKMLSTLTGRNYRAYHVQSSNKHSIRVNVTEVVQNLGLYT